MCPNIVPEPAELEKVSRDPSSSPRFEDCAVIRRSFFRRKYACGHRGLRRFAFSIWGHEVRLSDKFLATNGLCPVCLLVEWRPKIIRCADCEGPIIPSSPIATPCRDQRDAGKDWLTIVPDNGRDLVVCCLCDIDNELFMGGYWNGTEIQRLRWVEDGSGI